MLWHAISAEETANELGTSLENGLNSAQISRLTLKYGENVLKEKKKKSIPKKFVSQFSDFMVIILFIAAFISFVVSLLSGEGEFYDPVIILLIVMINAIIGVIQESKAEKAIEELKKMAAPYAMVIRSGKKTLIKTSELLPGDLVLIETGDIIPADIRITKTVNLLCEESALTGESLPSEKNAIGILPTNTSVADRKNMLYMGSSVSMGRGEGIVVETGMNTQMGKIAQMIDTVDSPETPLSRKLSQIGKVLGICALFICAVIFIIGVLRKQNILEMFIMSVSLAVAAIPEGLPAVVTIVLSLGVRRMADKNVIVRKLQAVETLGSATVICSDKTGTLTENKMEVKKIFSFSDEKEKIAKVLRYGTLCNNSTLSEDKIIGEPTEVAIAKACDSDIEYLNEKFPRVKEVPFDSKRKMMTTVHKIGEKYLVITKGAPDFLVSRCSYYMKNDIREEMTVSARNIISNENVAMAQSALRVLCVAYKEIEDLSEALEEGLCFLGLIGLMDPPRAKVKDAVRICKEAGIKTVMITGDHKITAKAIGEEIGICENEEEIITGAQLDKMDEGKLKDVIEKYKVFARVSPEHKVKIVKAFSGNGHIVAMTGDGVNDAPALNKADIGCAMGKGGTEVAKSASDLIIADDDFSTIVEAVREGRGIYRNIMKTVHFLISCNIGELLATFLSIILNFPLHFEAIQLLWVNLITDSLPAIALGCEPIEEDIMKKPAQKSSSLFSKKMIYDMAIEGMQIGALSVLAYAIGRMFFDVDAGYPIIARTMAFAVLSLSQIAHAFNMRSANVFNFKKSKLLFSALICVLLQVSVIEIAFLSSMFKTQSLSLLQWIIVVVLSLMPLLTKETEKRIFNDGKNHKKY